MLAQLSVQNFAVIKNITIEFDTRLSVLTGETGAGKSVIIDALALAMGHKASKEAVRTGCEKAVVQAVFFVDANHAVCEIMQQAGIETDEQLVFTREISSSGRSICRVNSTLVTAALLRKLGERLVDIHGQHEHQSLLDKSNHVRFLDQFSPDTLTRAQQTKAAYNALNEEKKKLRAMQEAHADAGRIKAELMADIAAIETASPQIDEDSEIERKISRIKNRTQFVDNLRTAHEQLYGSDASALGALLNAAAALESLAELDDSFLAQIDAIHRAIAETEDVAHGLQKHLAAEESDEHIDLDALESRAYELTLLKRKYGASLEEVLETKKDMQERLMQTENLDEALSAQQTIVEQATKTYFDNAKMLTRLRRGQKAKFEGIITAQLSELAMPNGRFEVSIQPRKDERAISAEGQDDVEFLFSANKGMAPKALTKIASGGEVSRLMLAMKIAVTDSDIQTLVFDEIDTGISGITAQKMAEKLRALSANYQVLLVSHLPQIAAMAHAHFCAVKTSDDESTSTQIKRLDKEGREHEIAKMIGTEKMSDSALAHARQMLAAAKAKELHLP